MLLLQLERTEHSEYRVRRLDLSIPLMRIVALNHSRTYFKSVCPMPQSVTHQLDELYSW